MRNRFVKVKGTNISLNATRITELAEAGDPLMQTTLGMMILSKTLPFRRREEGVTWLKRAAEGGDPLGMYMLARAYGVEKDLDPDGSEARAWIERSAKAGHPAAQAEYGMSLLDEGADIDQVDYWVTSAFNGGDCRGVYALGSHLVKNNPPESDDYRYGVMKLTNAAFGGISDATMELVGVYLKDDNRFMAARMLRKASSQDHPLANYILGTLKVRGTPYIEKDQTEAFALLSRSMEQGCREAGWTLGSMYLYGVGVEADPGKALGLLADGYENDHPISILNLGVMFLEGIGVEKDPEIAANLFQRASELGSREATNNLGVMYAVGIGVQRDSDRAEKLFREAADKGEPNAEINIGLL